MLTITFISLSRFIVMLNWFVDQEVPERVTRGGDIVQEDEVECRPEKITRKCLDVNVCVGLIQKYFSFDAWDLCALKVVGPALCVTQTCIPWRAFAVMVALIGSI